jgi:hypothetical protein
MANMTPAHIKVLSDWMLSYKPQELFDAQGSVCFRVSLPDCCVLTMLCAACAAFCALICVRLRRLALAYFVLNNQNQRFNSFSLCHSECLPIHMRMVNSCDKILQRQTKPWFVGGMLLRALRLPEFGLSIANECCRSAVVDKLRTILFVSAHLCRLRSEISSRCD